LNWFTFNKNALAGASHLIWPIENKNFFPLIWIPFEKSDFISDIKGLKKENTEPGFELLP